MRAMAMVVAVTAFAPAAARSQTTPPAPTAASGTVSAESGKWIVLGGTSTTLRGDCQEDCVGHGTGAYLHSGSVVGIVGCTW